MAPKRKVAPKSKPAVPKTIEDMPNVTVRRPLTKDDFDENQEGEESVKVPRNIENNDNMNVTVLIEKLPDSVTKLLDKDSGPNLEDKEEEELNKKSVQKKTTKKKLNSKKQTVEEDTKLRTTRAVSEDRQTTKAVEKLVIKNRKRPVNKGVEPKSISPVNDPPKRNRRAASVDILLPENSRNRKGTKGIDVAEDETPKKNVKKEQPKFLEKNIKTKKNTKKVVNEVKEYVMKPEENNDKSPDMIPEKSRPKRGVKKEHTNEHPEEEEEDIEDESESIPKQASKSRRALKSKQQTDEKEGNKKQKRVTKSKKPEKSPEKSEESSGKNDIDDTEIIIKKHNPKSKKIKKIPEKSEGALDGKNDTDESDVLAKTPEIKSKRVRKIKQIDIEQNDDKKEIKPPKRGGRKVESEEFENEVPHKSPLASNDEVEVIKTDDLSDIIPDSPELGKNTKPTAAKRKRKVAKK